MARTFAEIMQRALTGRRQADAARELGLTQAQVSRWVRGEGLPKDEFIPRLAKFTGRSEESLRRLIESERGTFRKPRRPVDRFSGLEERMDRLEESMIALLAELRGERPEHPASNGGDDAPSGQAAGSPR